MKDEIILYLIKHVFRFLKENEKFYPTLKKKNINNINDIINNIRYVKDKYVEKIYFYVIIAMYGLTKIVYDKKMNLLSNELVQKWDYYCNNNITKNILTKNNLWKQFINLNQIKKDYFYNNITEKAKEKTIKKLHIVNSINNSYDLIILEEMKQQEEISPNINFYTNLYNEWMNFYKENINNKLLII